MMGENIQWSPGVTLEAIEKMVILKAYEHFRRNKTVTANALGIAIRTLDTKLEKYELEALAESERQANERARKAELLNRARGNPPNNEGIPYSPHAISSGGQIQMGPTHGEANAGVHVESAVKPTQKYEVPVSIRPEVQAVLYKNTPAGGKRK